MLLPSPDVILISSQAQLTQMALLKRSGWLKKSYVLTEFFASSSPSLVGSIYKAKVVKNHPGLGACFADIAPGKAVFLYDKGRGDLKKPFYAGQDVMVQIDKDSLKGKNPSAHSRISLPGRFLVYLPSQSSYVGLSRQILNNRAAIKEQAKTWAGEDSFIIRTLGAKAPKELLKKELNALKKLWGDIQNLMKDKKSLSLLWEDLPLPLQVLRDVLLPSAGALILTDSQKVLQRAEEFIKAYVPKFKGRLQFYEEDQDLFKAYHLEEKIAGLLEKKVWLKSGGFLIIEETAAGVIVDVNTGRAKSGKSIEPYLLKTNLEAAKELCRQLRLRNCGGIVLIDFIDMRSSKGREKLMNTLHTELKKDRAYTELFPLSELGIVQMTRKRQKASLLEVMCRPCPACHGRSYVKKDLF